MRAAGQVADNKSPTSAAGAFGYARARVDEDDPDAKPELLAIMTGGGISMGVACGAAAITPAGRTSDHLVEATLTAVAAYGSFLLAENFGFSGVLATVAAGLLMGNLGVLREDENRNIFSPDGRSFVIALREFGHSSQTP